MVVVVMRVTTLKATADKLRGLLAYYAGLGRGPGRYGPAAGRWTTTWIRTSRRAVVGSGPRRARRSSGTVTR